MSDIDLRLDLIYAAKRLSRLLNEITEEGYHIYPDDEKGIVIMCDWNKTAPAVKGITVEKTSQGWKSVGGVEEWKNGDIE